MPYFIIHNGWRHAVVVFYGLLTTKIYNKMEKELKDLIKATENYRQFPSISTNKKLNIALENARMAVKNNAVSPLVSGSSYQDGWNDCLKANGLKDSGVEFDD